MLKHVRKFVRECSQCQDSKTRHTRTIGPYTSVVPPLRRWSEVSLDFITKLPLTLNGLYDTILVVMDSTSKRVHLIPAMEKGLGAVKAAELYFKNVFKHHGLPDRILSDRDTRFTSKFWTSLWKRCGAKLSMTTAYHQQANPANERVHKVIEELLRSLTQYPPLDWDEHLDAVEFAINNSPTDTGYTPFELDTGQHPRDPRTIWIGDLRVDTTDYSNQEQLLKQWNERLNRAHRQLLEALRLSKEQADRHRREPDFGVGDKVMLRAKFLNWPGVDLLGKHFKPPNVGPFTVIKMTKTNVTLEWNKPGLRIHPVQPINRVFKYHEDTSSYRRHLTTQRDPPPVSDVVDEEYEIEKIVARRRRGKAGRFEYLVKWKGYSTFHNMWLPESELESASRLVQNYNRKFPKPT